MMEKYAYFRAHLFLPGKYGCGDMKKLVMDPGEAETTRDYDERISFEFTQESISQHFCDSRCMSMEGYIVKTSTAEYIKLYQEGLLQLISEADA